MGPLKRVTTQVGLEKGLGLKSTSATQAISCRFRPSHGLLINGAYNFNQSIVEKFLLLLN